MEVDCQRIITTMPFSTSDLERLLDPPRLLTRSEVLSRPSPVPPRPGVYAWYFDRAPPGVDTSGCHSVAGRMLLYVGISPKAPPVNGRAPSSQNLRKRLRTHYSGNAEGSTLRLTLGCLLVEEIGIALRRVGSGTRYTFTNPGECRLDDWMSRHAFVTWIEADRPWELEREILASGLALPLNIHGREHTEPAARLSAIRSEARRRANEMPVVADSGGPRRPSLTSATMRIGGLEGQPSRRTR